MKITHIKQQKRNLENVNLFLNNKFWVSISKNQMLDFQVSVGMELNEELKLQIESASEENKVLEKVLNYASFRPRSKSEIKSNLIYKKNYDESLVNSVIEKLEEKKSFIVDDEYFARWFVENRQASGTHGVNKIKSELMAKGVNSNIIKKVIDSSQPDLELQIEKIEKFIQKNLPKPGTKSVNKFDWTRKITQKLMARGFRFEEIRDLVNKYKNDVE